MEVFSNYSGNKYWQKSRIYNSVA